MSENDIEYNSRLIGHFMGGKFVHGEGVMENRMYFKDNWYHMPLNYHVSWGALIGVGKKMQHLVVDGNWGLYEQFFSDELHGLDNFKKACSDFDIVEANKWAVFFIKALEHQDPEILKKAKENGN